MPTKFKYKIKEEKFNVGDVEKSRGVKSTVTYVDPITGTISWDIENIPAIDSVFKEFEELRRFIDVLDRGIDDVEISLISKQVIKLFNQYRTHIRKNYPEFYKKTKTNEQDIEETSTSGGAGSYLTPKAFKKNKYQYKLPGKK